MLAKNTKENAPSSSSGKPVTESEPKLSGEVSMGQTSDLASEQSSKAPSKSQKRKLKKAKKAMSQKLGATNSETSEMADNSSLIKKSAATNWSQLESGQTQKETVKAHKIDYVGIPASN
jgi:hypothetical protein